MKTPSLNGSLLKRLKDVPKDRTTIKKVRAHPNLHIEESAVTSSAKDLANLMSLFEAMLGDADMPIRGPTPRDRVCFATELAARLPSDERARRADIHASDPIALLAAHFDGGLPENEQLRGEIALAVSPAGLQDVIASLNLLENLASQRSSAPLDLIDTAIDRFWNDRKGDTRSADIVLFRGKHAGASLSAKSLKGEEPPLAFDSFHLLAAATDEDPRAILCRSRSGLLTLEIFVGKSEQDQAERLGHLLLTVHPDHRAAYEGRIARMFVMIGDEERVLAEDAVRGGEVYLAISLAETDLWGEGAVNVVFGVG
jgi:hypothetical protein